VIAMSKEGWGRIAITNDGLLYEQQKVASFSLLLLSLLLPAHAGLIHSLILAIGMQWGSCCDRVFTVNLQKNAHALMQSCPLGRVWDRKYSHGEVIDFSYY